MYQIKSGDQCVAYDFSKHRGWERKDNKDKAVCPGCET